MKDSPTTPADHLRHWIYPPLLKRTIVLASAVWGALQIGRAMTSGMQLDLLSSAVVVAASVLVVRIESRRHSAHLFFANLGISPASTTTAALATAVILEITLQATLRMVSVS